MSLLSLSLSSSSHAQGRISATHCLIRYAIHDAIQNYFKSRLPSAKTAGEKKMAPVPGFAACPRNYSSFKMPLARVIALIHRARLTTETPIIFKQLDPQNSSVPPKSMLTSLDSWLKRKSD